MSSELDERVEKRLRYDRDDAEAEGKRLALLGGCSLTVIAIVLLGIGLIASVLLGHDFHARDVWWMAGGVVVLVAVGRAQASSDEARDIRDRRLIRIEMQMKEVLDQQEKIICEIKRSAGCD